jgi:hypothetical protein
MAQVKIPVEQLENETRQDYIKFCVFLGMGANRNLNAAYKMFYETEKEVTNLWRTISVQNKWFERASEHDKAVAQLKK